MKNELTLVLFVIFLSIVQTLQHAPQVRDAKVEGNLLVFARVAISKQIPHLAGDAAALALELFTEKWGSWIEVSREVTNFFI